MRQGRRTVQRPSVQQYEANACHSQRWLQEQTVRLVLNAERVEQTD